MWWILPQIWGSLYTPKSVSQRESGVGISAVLLGKGRHPIREVSGISATPLSSYSCSMSQGSHCDTFCTALATSGPQVSRQGVSHPQLSSGSWVLPQEPLPFSV